ncbi:MAG: UbiD family decarboxylase, partial [Rhodospirillales bacterium]|nr:UbiD family decarboxylase [Rhodospirillales bacterium]
MDDIRPQSVDTEAFSLRRFVEKLAGTETLETIDGPVKLSEIASHLDGNPKAVLFRDAGPEGVELVGNVMGSRERLALALGVDERELMTTVAERLNKPIPPIEISRAEAPVQQIVLEGDDADLTALPAHLQHDLDGAPYISASLDFSVDQRTGFTNVGMRRLMLRGRRQAGVDMQAPSDFKAIYGDIQAKNQTLPVAFVVGFHPADAIAAVSMMPAQDDFGLIGGLRGAAVPTVKCITNDLRVPADAE